MKEAFVPFSPNDRIGTRRDPLSIAILMNPCRFFKTNSMTPGLACSDSSAPPITIVIALPGPFSLQSTTTLNLRDKVQESLTTFTTYTC